MTSGLPLASAAWFISIELPVPIAARRRRERWGRALKAIGVVLLLVAIAT